LGASPGFVAHPEPWLAPKRLINLQSEWHWANAIGSQTRHGCANVSGIESSPTVHTVDGIGMMPTLIGTVEDAGRHEEMTRQAADESGPVTTRCVSEGVAVRPSLTRRVGIFVGVYGQTP